jgi:biotin operon repressor
MRNEKTRCKKILKRNDEKVSLAALQQKLGASRVMLSSGFKKIFFFSLVVIMWLVLTSMF